jgi:hypothetical protein
MQACSRLFRGWELRAFYAGLFPATRKLIWSAVLGIFIFLNDTLKAGEVFWLDLVFFKTGREPSTALTKRDRVSLA